MTLEESDRILAETRKITWDAYQGLTLDGLYVKSRDKLFFLKYGKVIKQSGDMVYAILLYNSNGGYGMESINMRINTFKHMFVPYPDGREQFEIMYNKVKLSLDQLIKDYEDS